MTDQDQKPPETTSEVALEDASTDVSVDATSETESLVGTITESRHGKIKHVSIVEEMQQSYLDYAMSVIVARALPDVRDGLKPVHRRILFSMHSTGIHHSKPYKKSARIVGDVLGKYHPHGDAPVYMALVRLAQDFSMRYPLIDGQGNFGSVDGDSPAAMRYTEARLAKITQELLADIGKNTVGFTDNFDGSLQEPTVLPTRLPNLLLMGAEGIAVGMATKIPPHNLTEVSQAVLDVIKSGHAKYHPDTQAQSQALVASVTDAAQSAASRTTAINQLIAADSNLLAGVFESEITIDQIMEQVQGPDFPTAGIIYDRKAIIEAYKTGKGRIIIRSKASIEETKKGGFQIIITELPYQVNKARLIEKIAQLAKDKKLEGIKDINDDSDRKGMQITIDLKRDARPKLVLNKLFKYTELQTTFPLNMVALRSDGTPQLMNIKHILMEYVAHRQLVVTRRSQYELKEAQDRAHILEGLIIALNNLDDVIETIRRSPDTDTARTNLMSKFGLTEIQATAILEMQLKRLAALERQKIEDEYQAIQQTIGQLITLLTHPDNILQTISQETQDLIVQYGDDRRTKVVKGKIGELSEEDLVADEETVITLTESGYIKRLNPAEFRAQARGGKGKIGMTTKDEDVVRHLLVARTHDHLLLFTNTGRVFKMKVYEMTVSSRQAKGTAVVNLINLKAGERVQSLLTLNEQTDAERFITLATRDGLVKKTAVKLYDNIRQNGIVGIALNEGDELVGGRLTSGTDHIMLITHQGKSIRFTEEEIKASNRDTKGVRGITLRKDDFLVGMESFSEAQSHEDGSKRVFRQLLLVTERGMGKRTALTEYPVQKRSGQGVKVAEITPKTGPVAAAMMVTHQHEDLVVTTNSGQTIKLPITRNSIPTLTRPTQGVILMRLKDSDRVVAAALTWKDEAIGAAPEAAEK